MDWSPEHAMKAYLDTLHMCKLSSMHDEDEEQRYGMDGSKIIEPQGVELLSALAAGNQATRILDITTSQQLSITPLTLSLAVAAKQTGGQLICIRPPLQNWDIDHDHQHDHTYENWDNDPNDVIKLRVGDPCELANDIQHVDFAVIDCTNLDSSSLRLLSEKLHLNPKGAIIVANNILCREQGVALIDQLLKGKRGVESSVTTLPLGSSSGFQLIIKIKFLMGNTQRRRKHKRFFVTID
ncbi:Phenylalanine--tRNA ligase beta subunit [Bienertia sinuspersici]